MLITQREAAARLVRFQLSRTSAKRVLAAGLAGEPVRAGGALWYDEDRVRALAERRGLPRLRILELCPEGLVVIRSTVLSVTRPRAEQLACIDIPWDGVALWTRAGIGAALPERSYPVVGTVCGFVVVGADLTGFRRDEAGVLRTVLDDPGPWFDGLRDRLLPTSQGGRRYEFLHPWRLTPRRRPIGVGGRRPVRACPDS